MPTHGEQGLAVLSRFFHALPPLLLVPLTRLSFPHGERNLTLPAPRLLPFSRPALADPRTFISMVPTSAITGEGIPDLLLYLVAMTQRTLREDIILAKEVTATVLEVGPRRTHSSLAYTSQCSAPARLACVVAAA